MPGPYLTGRTTSMRLSGVITGRAQRKGGPSGPPGGPAPPHVQEINPLVSLSGCGGSVGFQIVGPYASNLYKLVISARAEGETAASSEILPDGAGLLSVDLAGTYEIVVEQLEEVLTPSEAEEWPGYAYRRGVGGTPVSPLRHGLHWRDASLSLRRVLGTAYHATITVGGVTVTSSGASMFTTGGGPVYGVNGTVQLFVGDGDAALDVTAELEWGGLTEVLSMPLSYNAGVTRANCTDGFHVAIAGNPSFDGMHDYRRIVAIGQPVPAFIGASDRRRLKGESALVQGTPLSGSEYRWTSYGGPAIPDDPEAPGSKSVTVVSAGGVVDRADVLRDYAGTIGAGATSPATVASVTASEWQRTARVYARMGWLSAGEDPNAWRCLLVGHRWPALTLSQDASRVVDDADPGNWTAGAHTTVGGSAGAMTLAVSGGAGGATRAFSPDENLEEFRYLEVRVKADDTGQPITVELGTKTWTFTTSGTAGTYTDLLVDLRSPHNATADHDATDSRYPLASDGLPATGNDGPLSGVSRCPSLVLSGLADGVTYTLASVTLVRTTRSRASVMLPFGLEGARYVGGPGSRWSSPDVAYNILRFLTGETDGKPSLEATAWLTRVDSGDAPDYPNILLPTIAELVDQINADCAAWHASAEADEGDGYHGSDRPALLVGGSGALYGSGAWEDVRDLAAESALTLDACDLWDGLSTWPGCGDFAGTGDYGETVFRFRHFLRADACGVVLNASSHEPLPGVEVQITLDGAGEGSGTSGALGWYETGTPAAPCPQTVTVTALAGSRPSATVTAMTRRRKQVAFRVLPETAGGLTADVHPGTLRHVRVHSESSTLRVSRATTVLGGGWTAPVDTGIEGEEPCIRFQEADRQSPLWLAYRDTGDLALKVALSSDDGETWGLPLTLFSSGHFPALTLTPAGVLYSACVDGGALKVQTWGTRLEVLVAETTAVASGVTDDSLVLRTLPRAGGRRALYAVYEVSGAVYAIVSLNDGQTWGSPLLVASGATRPGLAAAPDSTLRFFWRDTGSGDLLGRYASGYDDTASGIPWLSDVFTVASTIDDSPIDARTWVGGGGAVPIAVLYVRDGAVLQAVRTGP